jgi:hypothetical protein
MADSTAVEAATGPTDELSGELNATPHVEHEAPAADDDLSLADLSKNPPAESAAVDNAEAPADESNPEPQQASPDAEPEKEATATAKAVSTVKSAATKANGAASGVKKVCTVLLCSISFSYLCIL